MGRWTAGGGTARAPGAPQAGCANPRPPARRARRLKQQLPRGRALSELRITAEGHRVVVRDEAIAWHPESGQLVLDFDVATLAQRAAPLARRRAAAARRVEEDLDAEQWFALGLELEVSEACEAPDAYRRALDLDPHQADPHGNRGRRLVEADR